LNSKIVARTAPSQSTPKTGRFSRLLLALTLSLASTNALAEACYISSDFTDELIFVGDVTDASTTRVVGGMGVPDIETLAKDPVSQNLYGADANDLGVFNLDTGAYTSLGAFGTAFAANGDLLADRVLADIDSLGFHPTTGVLYAVQNSSEGAILFQVNKGSGALVPGAMGGNDYLLVTGGAADELAIDLSGDMYFALPTQLASVDHTAVGTVALVTINTYGPGITDMEGMAITGANTLIGSTGDGGDPNKLWSIDRGTGAATLLSAPGLGGDYEGIGCYFTPVDVELTKSVALTNDVDASGYFSTGDQITYSITVENADPSALVSEVIVTDDLSGLAGLSFVSSSDTKPANSSYDSLTGTWTVGVIPAGTSYTLNLVYNVGAAAVPLVINTAEVASAGNPDIDSTPGNDDGDQSEDDEDLATLHLNPEIGVVKSATSIGALKGDGTFDVEYTLLVQNTGGAELSNLTLIDDLSDPTQLGSTFNGIVNPPVVSLVANTSGNLVLPTTAGAAFTGTGGGTGMLLGTDGTIGLLDQFQVVFSVNVDPNAAGAPAALDNTATAGGTPPGGTAVTDDSNTGTDAAGAGTGELPGDNPGGPGTPTPITPPTPAPQLGIVKSVSSIGAIEPDGTFDVSYTLLIENTGKEFLTPLTLVDDLSAATQLGTAFNGVVTAPVVTIVTNTSGNAVAPTSSGAAFTGTGAGTALIIGTDGRIDADDQYQVTFTINVDPNAAGAPAALDNTATAGGTPPSGTPISDDSNTGTDAAGAGTGETPNDNPGGPGVPTPITPPTLDPELGLVKSATTIGTIKGDGTFDVTYTLLTENTGNAALTPLTLTDELDNATQLGSAFNGIVTAPAVTLTTNVSGNAVAPTTNGAAFTGTGAGTALILGTDGRLDPGDQYTVTFTVNVDPNAAGAPAALDNTATTGGTPPSGPAVTDDSNTGTDAAGAGTGENPDDNPGGPGAPTPITPPTPDAELGVVKSATSIGAIQGDGTFDVTYTLLIENTGDQNLTPLTLTDDLSAATQLGSAFNGIVTAPAVTLVTNTSGNAVAPTTNGAAFTGTGAGTALIIGTDGRIDAGDQYQVTFTINVDPNATGAPAALDNTATAGGTPPSGTPISDDSNTGTDASGTGTGERPPSHRPHQILNWALLNQSQALVRRRVTARSTLAIRF